MPVSATSMQSVRPSTCHTEPQAATVKRGLKAMLDGVLHQRDQHGGGTGSPASARQFQRKRQAIAHPRLHDGEECRRHFKFTPKRGGLGAQPAKPARGR